MTAIQLAGQWFDYADVLIDVQIGYACNVQCDYCSITDEMRQENMQTAAVMAQLSEARARGAATIGVACNEHAPVHQDATVAITLLSGGEVLAGSTRMGAGTAQKAALNLLSTLIAIKLGHMHDGMMVNVRPENEKLRARAAGIVARIAQVDAAIAQEKLREANFEPKIAILLAAGAASVPDAAGLLTKSHGHLRPALAWLGATPPPAIKPAAAKASGTK